MGVSMQRCSACGTTNQAISQYCERCGSLLKTSSTSVGSEVEYTIPSMQMPPPPPTSDPYQTPPSSPYTVPYVSSEGSYRPPDERAYYLSNQQAYQPADAGLRQIRTAGNTVLGVILYLPGMSSTALGTFGGLEGFVGDSWATVSLLAVLLLCSVALIVVLVRYRSAHLRWWQRLLLWICLSGLVTLLTLLSYGILDARMNGAIPTTTEDVLFGSAFICYGLLTMFLALW
jgi:hypothetical protein